MPRWGRKSGTGPALGLYGRDVSRYCVLDAHRLRLYGKLPWDVRPSRQLDLVALCRIAPAPGENLWSSSNQSGRWRGLRGSDGEGCGVSGHLRSVLISVERSHRAPRRLGSTSRSCPSTPRSMTTGILALSSMTRYSSRMHSLRRQSKPIDGRHAPERVGLRV